MHLTVSFAGALALVGATFAIEMAVNEELASCKPSCSSD